MTAIASMKKAGTSQEDKQAWVTRFKKTMETHDELPLLFQTMTAASFMNVKALLDELCKSVAGMIAIRTPAEIKDFFNVQKDATWEEEQDLCNTHKVSFAASTPLRARGGGAG